MHGGSRCAGAAVSDHSKCASSDASNITPISVTANVSKDRDQLPPSLAHRTATRRAPDRIKQKEPGRE
jgi:hypothetical protein